MILVVFEGHKDSTIFDAMIAAFFPKRSEQIVCIYENNIYHLYQELKGLGGDGDIVAVLREKYRGMPIDPLQNIKNSSEFSEIYLFFDLDFHDKQETSEVVRQIDEMLEMFDTETGNGKLYIHYPMLESIYYTQKLPDCDFVNYWVKKADCNNFKRLVVEFSYYKNLDFLNVKKMPMDSTKENWQMLCRQNIEKANFLCSQEKSIPCDKEDISQRKIFDVQKEQYILAEPCRVSILNAFPLFLYDYFPTSKWDTKS